jgi:ferritin
MAGFFKDHELGYLNKLFVKQSSEERSHALKFIDYLWETQSIVQIPAIPAPESSYSSAEDVLASALKWEKEVTRRINELMKIAVAEGDFQSQSFLKWFIDEQLEEESSMLQLLNVVRMSGEKNLLMVEAYLAHLKKAD